MAFLFRGKNQYQKTDSHRPLAAAINCQQGPKHGDKIGPQA